MASSVPDSPKQLRLRVTAAAESAIRSGHPWVFSESIRSQNREGRAGEFAVIYDRADRFLAIGLFDPDSPLRVRVLHQGKPARIDAAWWRSQFRTAVERRHHVFDAQTTGYRCIHGENDGWPGLVLDRYGATLVLKLYTAAWLPLLESIQSLIAEEWPSSRLVLRLSRNIQPRALTSFQKTDGQILFGGTTVQRAAFLETGLSFEADVLRGQKTGFFLDQRDNRRRVEALASKCAVLNTFSFSGAFSVYAARGGAKSVVDLDISAHALHSAERNFALNRHQPAVAACQREGVQADAFEWLRQRPFRRFDMVILDPPSLAKREAERARALRAYGAMAQDAVRWLTPGGVLVAASCSAHVEAEEFFAQIRNSVRAAGRSHSELGTHRHPADHPATFPEAAYLKSIYLRVAAGPLNRRR